MAVRCGASTRGASLTANWSHRRLDPESQRDPASQPQAVPLPPQQPTPVPDPEPNRRPQQSASGAPHSVPVLQQPDWTEEQPQLPLYQYPHQRSYQPDHPSFPQPYLPLGPTSDPRAGQPTHPQLPPEPRSRGNDILVAVVFAVCQLGGIAAVVHSYLIAQTRLTSTSEFAWFWVGMFLLELPIAGLVARKAMPRAMRTALLTLYGFVSFAPKLLRNPTSPLFHDEFAHWRATYDILSTGKLFEPDPIISIISRYPGLHAATAALVHATGLSIWQAAEVLLLLFHVSLVLGIAALAQSLGLSSRAASVVAILYCLNSSFLYFDTQYAYESMAITLLVWALVAYIRAIRSQRGRGRAAWCVITVAFSVGTVVTHPLSALALVLTMLLISLAMSVPRLAMSEAWVRTATTSWCLTLTTALAAGAWLQFVAPATISYLSPYPDQAVSELINDLRGAGSTRQLFGATITPWWEQKSAYLVPVFALALAAAGLLLIRAQLRNGDLRRGPRRALLLAFAVMGIMYFPSTAFILSPTGAEGARRSWAFTWIGLSILVGPAVVWALDWAGRQTRRWLSFSVRSGLLAALAIALVGGTAAGLDPAYRFPGPFLYGSDARSITPELLATSEWFSARFGTSNNIITDRNTGLVFASYGLQSTGVPSPGFPFYNLYLVKPGAPIKPPYLLFELNAGRYTYLIVDQRIADEIPETGVYFGPTEPNFITKAGKSAFQGRLGKFNTYTWMVKVFQSNNYSIYRLNLPISKITYQPKPPKAQSKLGKLSVTP
jgi:hypothetical protein